MDNRAARKLADEVAAKLAAMLSGVKSGQIKVAVVPLTGPGPSLGHDPGPAPAAEDQGQPHDVAVDPFGPDPDWKALRKQLHDHVSDPGCEETVAKGRSSVEEDLATWSAEKLVRFYQALGGNAACGCGDPRHAADRIAYLHFVPMLKRVLDAKKARKEEKRARKEEARQEVDGIVKKNDAKKKKRESEGGSCN